MKYKNMIIFLLTVFFLLSVAGVSAGDASDVKMAVEDGNQIELSEMEIDNLQSSEEKQAVTQVDNGTFQALNYKIKTGSGTVYLENDYGYAASDDFVEGIEITKSITIDGQGHTIDAKQKARIFNVTAADVVLKNITFINGYTTGNGGAIHWSSNNANISDCYFENNTADLNGGANYFENELVNSSIDAKYVNNKAMGDDSFGSYGGGANRFDQSLKNVVITGEYTKNTAPDCGGANDFRNTLTNVTINADYNYNTAFAGGANKFRNTLTNVTIYGNYYNNTASCDGGANEFINTLTNVTINGNYTDNKATRGQGGANHFFQIVSNVNMSGNYINNTASYGGGANYFENELINSNINAAFVNNLNYGQGNSGGGANCFNRQLRNVNITGDFINNTDLGTSYEVNGGGANYFKDALTDVNIIGNFEYNKAERSGGANRFYNTLTDVNIIANFINNTAKGDMWGSGGGGANYFYQSIYNVNISGNYINNTAIDSYGAANSFNRDIENSVIRDSIFINNRGENIIYNRFIPLINCWFGNNATNYNETPDVGINLNNWLFLNATSSQNPISIIEESDITFKLYSCDSVNVTDYDNGRLQPINLMLSSVNGDVDKNATGFESEVKYRLSTSKGGSITASIENAAYTIEVNGVKADSNLSAECQAITYGENATITLNYHPKATGKVNITLSNKKHSKSYDNLPLNNTILLDDEILPGEYNVTVMYSGDDNFFNATANATLTVIKANSTLTVHDITFDYKSTGSSEVSFTGASGVTATVIDHNEAIVDVDDGKITVSNLNAGNYTLSVTTIAYENYNNITKTAKITVNKINSTLDVNDVILDYGGSEDVGVTSEGALNITAKIDDENVTVVNGKVQVCGLKAGNHTLTVTTVPDDNHIAVTRAVKITVNKVNSSVDVDDLSSDYGKSTHVNVTVEGALGITAKFNGELIIFKGYSIPIPLSDAGTYNLTVTTVPDENHTQTSRTIKITVNKVNSTVKVNDVILDYGETANITAETEGAVSITAKIGDDEALVRGNTIEIPSMDVATYTLTVTTVPDANHNPVTETAKVIVNKVNSTLKVNDMVFDYNGTGSSEVSFTGAIGIEASVKNQPKAIVNVTGDTITVSGLDVGLYTLTVTTVPDANHNAVTGTASITVNKIKTVITADGVTTTYNINKDLVITLRDGQNNSLSGVNLTVKIDIAKNYTTDKDGQVIIATGSLIPNKYVAEITFNGDDKYAASNATANVVVKKATPSLTAKSKSFQDTDKAKRYAIVLKDNTGKPIKNVKVYLKVNGRVYSAVTDNNGKAIFKLTKLTKKGTYKALIVYKGDNKYNKIGKKVKIAVKTTFKTVGPGSKDKTTVKKIQKALKSKGYYLSYKGHYLMIDGYYGSCTQRSVKEFQSANGLKVTGSVDYKTAKKLGII